MSHASIDSLLAPVEHHLLLALMREWDWALPVGLRLVGLTKMGDWLFEEEGGAVLMLETVEATVSRVAGSLHELKEIASSTEARDRVFLEGLALGVLSGGSLPPNHCIGFKTPPVLGGRTDVSNLEVVPVTKYQTWTGRIHKAIRMVPEGRRITGVVVGDDGSVSVQWH